MQTQKLLFFRKPSLSTVSRLISTATATGPLTGVRILDLSRILAGPFCSMALGDLGAEVIKVERYGVGCDTRKWGPPFVGGESCYFIAVNRNKKSIAVDFKHELGRKLVIDLAKKSDVLLENYVPGKLDKVGLGYNDLKNIVPELIYCSITGFGPYGPYAKRAGYDVIAASMGGFLHITGPEDGDPVKAGVAITDIVTGLYAHGAIMAALLHRNKTGKGQKVDCNLLASQVSVLANIGSNYLNGNQEAKRWGTSHESLVPYATFKTADGFITAGAGSDLQFAKLCKIMDLHSLIDDPRYKTNPDRVKNRNSLMSVLVARWQEKTNKEWLNLLENCGFPYGPVNNLQQTFSDPHIVETEQVVTMQHKTAGEVKVVGPPVLYSGADVRARLPPPGLGEHTVEVLKGILEYDEKHIAQLFDQKVVHE